MGIIYHSYNLKRKKYILKTRKWKEPKIYLSHFINEKTETTIKKISSQISDISSKIQDFLIVKICHVQYDSHYLILVIEASKAPQNRKTFLKAPCNSRLSNIQQQEFDNNFYWFENRQLRSWNLARKIIFF